MLSNNRIMRAHSTIDETFDLRQAIEFDEEFMVDARPLVDGLEGCLKALYKSMEDGSDKFATGACPIW